MNKQPITYQTIDLRYLKEISMGEVDYERELAEKFIEIIPDEIALLFKALEKEDFEALRRAAHKMLSSIYLMGLKTKLNEHLDAIEKSELTAEAFGYHVKAIAGVCEKAKEEAKLFLNTLV